MSSKPTVFVVDDDDAMRNQLSFTLKSVKLEAKTFASAEAFLESFDPARPGCLVLDVRMAGMDGLELQKRLNEIGAVLPIVMISGHGDIPMAVSAMQAGAVDFLEKPFREQALLDRIRRAIERDARARRALAANADIQARLALLSERETQILDLLVAGKSNKMVGKELFISHKTVESHRTKIMDKMQAANVADLVRMVLVAEPHWGKP